MIFGRVPLRLARGGILAHNLQTSDRILRKGALIDGDAFERLDAAGYSEVTIARLEPGDVPEGQAAALLGQLLLAAWLRCSKDVHGRVNLFAERDGLLRLNVQKIHELNLIDESVALATLPDYSVVAKGDMIATLKIIPFAVSGSTMISAQALIAHGAPAFTLRPFRNFNVGLVLTKLPHLKDSTLTHTIEATRIRIKLRGGNLFPILQTPHEVAPLMTAIQSLLEQNADLILISGASAVTDRQDIAPQAIVEAGGKISHFGMPVDPGNLICFGKIGDRHAIVLPGCARSPKLNGIDWVLDRIFAGEDIGPRDIAHMGAGGLLKEIENRPAPRASVSETGFGVAPKAKPRVAAIVLAAGLSTRMAPQNKLLAAMPDGTKMIVQVVDRILASSAQPVIVVTGYQASQIRAALAGKLVQFVHAADYADGMAASLRAGIAALSASIAGALICLGDMPLVEAATLERIIAAYDSAEGREIILPSFNGRRGNPILWGQRFFSELRQLAGDTGARQILCKHTEFVTEILAETDAVLHDFDTPEKLDLLSKGDQYR